MPLFEIHMFSVIKLNHRAASILAHSKQSVKNGRFRPWFQWRTMCHPFK